MKQIDIPRFCIQNSINFFYFFLFFNLFTAIAQEKKSIKAIRIIDVPKIDGILDDAIWQSLPPYGGFFLYEPGNEGSIPEEYRTEVKMAYDDNAIYVAAYMYDPNPENILSQFSQRDEVFVQADNFVMALNTYNDGINETHFIITSAGTIGDAFSTQNNFDLGYNVVWECKISKDRIGWYAEFRIPYSALRFPEMEVQDWSVNFLRKITSRNESHSWNFIDNSKGRESQYSGLVTGIQDINPPVRLMLYPFAQGTVANFDGETESNFAAGMDVKYGLSDSFTLDATLIPDFGQASFDEVRLNLGPFEQTFGENRQFFEEGTDLFNKGQIFFSRRIGGSPSGDVGELDDNETVSNFPDKVNLLNALKISGRTKKDLAVGFFNAITEKTYAMVVDTITMKSRDVLVEPLSNYNIMVIDQQFNGNSSIGLINTNVIREGHFRDANATAFVFDVADKGDHFRTSGRAVVSNVNTEDGMVTGFRSEMNIFRIKGKFRYSIGHDLANETYDINDLGISFENNFNDFWASMSYQIFEPTETFNTYRIQLFARHRRLYDPGIPISDGISLNGFFVTKSRFAFGSDISYNSKSEDYYEPRVAGRFVTYGSNLGGNAWVSSDFRKKFAYELRMGYRTFYNGDPRENIFLDIAPRYRFSDQFLLVFESEFSYNYNNYGYIANTETDIYFGQRDIKNIENSIQASLNFDPYKAIDLRFRNFWSTADYSDNIFYVLNDDGSLSETDYDISAEDPNTNFNIWNLDLSFRWRFAPGSEATLLYRNQIFNQDNLSELEYGESLKNLFEQPIQNTISLRITYFIDYNNIKGLFDKSS